VVEDLLTILSSSLWDGLIIQSALRGGAEVLYTEDLLNGQMFESLDYSQSVPELTDSGPHGCSIRPAPVRFEVHFNSNRR
jgi:hypothetical protein